MRLQRSFVILFLLHASANSTVAWRSCSELSPALRLPCLCNVEPFGPEHPLGAVAVNCDGVVFQGEAPLLPAGAPIINYSQRLSGLQRLPTQAFGNLQLPIKIFDFSQNNIRRLPEKIFFGLKDSLTELYLQDNLLGDSLNPIFSSAEFHSLVNLRILDLSGNKIRIVEEGLLKGCQQLEKFIVNRNSLTSVPSSSLNGPNSLKVLSLHHNEISHLKFESFAAQPKIETIDLRYNNIRSIESEAFLGLKNITEIYLGGNRLSNFNSDVFEGIPSLERLDLSENFIELFPSFVLERVNKLRILNLSSNMIQVLESAHLQVIPELEILDLSRNGITVIPPGTFRDLKSLQYIDLSLNSLRTIEDDALEGLENLETLIIRDNNILLIPGSALGRLPRLSNLQLDFNRIAALSSEILGSIQPETVRRVSLSRNLIRELPPGSFQLFKSLQYLDLSGNSLAIITADMFMGLETSLKDLSLSQNRITAWGSIPLPMKRLHRLDISLNNLADIPRNAFIGLENLKLLNLSGNGHLAPIPGMLLHSLALLQIIDFSGCGIREVPGELFSSSQNLQKIILSRNLIQEINDGTFTDLRNISEIDLSYNQISSIRSSAFVNVMSLKSLILRGNQLTAFKGEHFNTGTGLEELDISENQLTYLFPSSFRIHPRLRKLIASKNKFGFFPSELISSLQYLTLVDLSFNHLKNIEELDFARLPRLRVLSVAHNQLESVSEMAFHNSTQLQVVDLSYNRLERIGERTFEGLIRLEMLNLEGNALSELPEYLFERGKLQMLENINLARNKFHYAPLNSLQRQYFFVSTVDLSYNKIMEIPADDSLLVNVKNLDLSFNPLTDNALENILSEPKTVRRLNLAGTGLKRIKTLETPFLQNLNISSNNLQDINENVFERSTLLESLDLSNNRILSLEKLSKVWPKLTSLHYLDLTNNSFETINDEVLDGLESLKVLKIKHLHKCSKIEKNAFKNLHHLSKLSAYDLPVLGYLDIKGILESLPGIQSINLEVKDSALETDQIQPAKHPRLKEIGLFGNRLKSISAGTLAGLKSNELKIKLQNTSLTSIPAALLFPVPRSSTLKLDITGSKVAVLSPQFLAALEDRRSNLKLLGLATNPIHCDCNARALRRWLPNSHMTEVKCSSPDYLNSKLLIEVGDDELTCETRRSSTLFTTARTTTAQVYKSASPLIARSTTSEPMIIWSLEPTQPSTKVKTKLTHMKAAAISNDDTLIIGIVGGVVAFIAILIIIICIVRLRLSNSNYENAPPIISMPPMPIGSGSVQINYKGGAPQHSLYALSPYTQNYVTLPHKALHQSHQNLAVQNLAQNINQNRPAYSTMGRLSYYPQQHKYGSNGQPFILPTDDKAYR